ncbi:HXXEE domain-containing protein [Saccharomonospora sp. NPDC006951]
MWEAHDEKDERGRPVSPLVTWGLFAAWLVHDAEELLTMPGWTERARPRLEKLLPSVPGESWDRLAVSRSHTAVAIGTVGAVVAAAAAAGARTGGRSGFYRSVLSAFGWHAVSHVAGSAATRGYTPGVVTAPTVVAPFSVWAWRELRKAGVPVGEVSWSSAALFPAVVAGAHGFATVVTRVLGRRSRKREGGNTGRGSTSARSGFHPGSAPADRVAARAV